MALIKMGAFITDIRGKIAGTVFSQNIGGNVAYNRPRPRKKPKPKQSKFRNLMQFYSRYWTQLSLTKQGLWKTYALNFTFKTKLGTPTPARANFVFQTTQIYYYAVNNTILGIPLTYAPPPILYNLGASIDADTSDAFVSFDAAGGELYLSIYASPPFRRGQETQMQSRLVNIMTVNQVNPSDTAAYFGPQLFDAFPYIQAGQYMWVGVRRIDPVCFSWSPIHYVLVAVT